MAHKKQYSDATYSEIANEINTNFGFAIFQNLMPSQNLKDNAKVRLFDATQHTSDIFYKKSNFGFCVVYSFSNNETYTPLKAYQKAHKLNAGKALQELQAQYLGGVGVARTYTPAKLTPKAQTNPLQVVWADIENSQKDKHKSNLVCFLRQIFDTDIIKQVLADYMVGFAKETQFDTVFWYANISKKVLDGKYFSYDKLDGKRTKSISWYHSYEKKDKPKIGFFGEHLIKPKIWIVESEKTAIVVAIILYLNEITDTVVWACGGLSNLESSFSNCTQKLDGKEITLIPDTDPATAVESSLKKWQKKLPLLQHLGANVGICFDLETNALPYQKEKKFDVADYEIAGFLRTNETVKTLHKKAYQYYLDTETAPLLQEFETPATNDIPATTKIETPAIELHYKSYENLFLCFNTDNLGVLGVLGVCVKIYVNETKKFHKNELELFFRSFDFGLSVEFEIFEVFDVLQELQRVTNIIKPQLRHN